MIRACLCLAVFAAGLSAREEKADLPEDLARVPGDSVTVFSLRVSKVWGGELGKAFHAVWPPKEFQWLGLDPEEIERLTWAALPVGGGFYFVRTRKKLDPKKFLPTILPYGKEVRLGVTVMWDRHEAAFLSPDGRTIVLGHKQEIMWLVGREKAVKPTGELEAMLRRATEHDVSDYTSLDAIGAVIDLTSGSRFLRDRKDLPQPVSTVIRLDFGYTSRFQLQQRFADEKAAARARLLIEGGRLAAEISLADAIEELAEGSTPIRKMLGRIEGALAEGRVKRKGKAVDTAIEVKLEKETADAAIKDWLTRPTENLYTLGSALIHSMDEGMLPPAATYDKDGKPLLSWRVAILPFIEQKALYKEFRLNEPWDSPHNKKLIPRMPTVFASPGIKPSAPGGTFYKVIYGKGAAFEGKSGARIGSRDRPINQNTILIVETVKDVPWTKPEDVAFDPDAKLPTLGGVREGGFYAYLADWSVRFVPATLRPEALKAMILRTGRTTPADRE